MRMKVHMAVLALALFAAVGWLGLVGTVAFLAIAFLANGGL